MAYATLADLKARLGSATSPPGPYQRLTDRTAMTTADDAVGQALLDEAAGVVSAYLAGRYAVPVDASSDMGLAAFLRGTTLDLAEYRAWQSSPIRKEMPGSVQAAYDNAIALLRRIADGDLPLPSAAALPGSTATGTTAEAVGTPRVFTNEAMEGLM